MPTPLRKHTRKLLITIVVLAALVCTIALIGGRPASAPAPMPEQMTTPSVSSTSTSSVSTQAMPTQICFAGDIGLGTFDKDYQQGLNPFSHMREKLKECDFVVANLESSVASTTTGVKQPKNYNFKAPPESVDLLLKGKIKVVSMANNHAMDYGGDALLEGISLVKAKGILPFGAGKNIVDAFTPQYLTVGSTKLAFIAINDVETNITNAKTNSPGCAYFDQALVKQSVETARQNADIVVVFPHWGDEGSTVVNSRQKTWAHMLIDWGANLVVGAGPHTRQASESYKGATIYYSLGNYAFSGFYGMTEGSLGRVMQVQIVGKKLKNFKTFDVRIDYYGFPAPI